MTNRDVTKCNNPTFVAGDLKRNKLAEVAPQPAACDKQGEGPCGTETGTGEPSTDDANAPTTGSTEPAGGKKGDKVAATPEGAPDPGGTPTETAVDPVTGEAVNPPAGATVEGITDTTSAGNEPLYATPTELSAERPMDSKAFGWLAVLELLALIPVPGILISRRAARNGAAR
ncbi:hypothetical protein [Nocardioides sp. B-3]|uniref:hypothetical protein n=1 Tax=Nocardioides sp. B-3 TaxID=2895565 RepID=UPI0021539592|nr:hypothetical protein [Nocardioides sp. B-3]UUZ61560.1 hypothetical protein LP418_14015 [Nocardioides sp. B-3]